MNRYGAPKGDSLERFYRQRVNFDAPPLSSPRVRPGGRAAAPTPEFYQADAPTIGRRRREARRSGPSVAASAGANAGAGADAAAAPGRGAGAGPRAGRRGSGDGAGRSKSARGHQGCEEDLGDELESESRLVYPKKSGATRPLRRAASAAAVGATAWLAPVPACARLSSPSSVAGTKMW